MILNKSPDILQNHHQCLMGRWLFMKTFIVRFVFIFIHVCTLSLLQVLGAEQTLVPHQMLPALLVQPSIPELRSDAVPMPDLASASTLPEPTKKRHRRKRINIPKKGHRRKVAVAPGLDEHAAVPRLMDPPAVNDPTEPAGPTELPALPGPVVPGLDEHSAVPRLMDSPAVDDPTEPAGSTELPALPGPVVPGLDEHAAVPRLMDPPAVNDPTEPAGPTELPELPGPTEAAAVPGPVEPGLPCLAEPAPVPDLTSLPGPMEPAALPVMVSAVQDILTRVTDFKMVSESLSKIVFASFYEFDVPVVKISVSWFSDYSIKVYVHGKQLSHEHPLWEKYPHLFQSVSSICQLLNDLNEFSVCLGNPDEDLLSVYGEGAPTQEASRHDYLALAGDQQYCATIRNIQCDLLIKGRRCKYCQKTRGCLRSKRARKFAQEGACHKFKANVHLTTLEKDNKLRGLAQKQKILKRKVNRLEDKIKTLTEKAHTLIETEGEILSSADSADIAEILNESQKELSSLPADSFQKILFDQQMQYNALKKKSSMRWHPAIIRWCLYIRSKSSKAYDGLRSCLALPSQRTLHDYSSYTESGVGFHPRVLEQLIDEAERKGLYNSEAKQYVGIVQDEVRIKQDPVYNKHTGELVGFIDLNQASNELLRIEERIADTGRGIAKYMLVIMVRGLCSNLQYPLAAFATEGITSGYLFPIVWEAIKFVQIVAELKVIFICCDGASSNRKFFTMHDKDRDKET